MTPFETITAGIDQAAGDTDARRGADALLTWGEGVLENWMEARDETPTASEREGFRLLALHRQGAKGDPSFNACRETCRELVYHRNLIHAEPENVETAKRLKMAAMVARHLCLFIQGKMREDALGEFCCSSRPLHNGKSTEETLNHA